MTALLAAWQICSPLSLTATPLYWDINQGTANSGSDGTGVWDGVLLNWNTDLTGTGGTPQAGTTSADALFFSSGTGLTSGTITVSAGRVANSLTFEETGVYTLNSGDITLSGANGLNFSNGTGANVINTALILGGSTAFTNSDNTTQTIAGGVTGTGNLTLTNNSTGGFTISTGSVNNDGTLAHTGSGNGAATISSVIGANVTEVIQNSATSQLNLSNGTNAFTALTIKSGSVQGAQNTAGQTTSLGTGTVTLGDSTGSASATLIAQGTQANYANPIILGLTSGTLTIRSVNTGTIVNFTGGITGTNNVTIATGATGTAGMNFSTNPINNTGTITHATTVATGALTISGGIGSNVTGVIQNSASAQFNLSGTNTYNGATSINAGTLALTGGGSLAGTAVTAIAGTTFLVTGNSTIGTSGSPSVTIAGGPTTTGGVLSLLGGTVNTLTLNSATAGATVLTLGGGAGNASQLNMDVGATSDQISLGSGLLASVGAGGVTVNITAIGGLTGATQTLISAPGGGLNTGGSFTLNAATGNFGGYTLGLVNTGTLLQLTEVANAAPAAAYWGGALSSTWNTFTGGNTNNSNWLNAPTGTDTNAAPGATTNVFMTADAASNLTTTLGQNFQINSLTFTGTGTAGTAAVSIGGSPNTLTINATNANGNTAGVGITKLTGSGADTISAPVILGGHQSWTNNASTLLTISGGVTGTANLTLNASSIGGITLSINSVNNTGTITNSGSGTGTATISAAIGSNVTSVTQAGVSPFIISSAFALNANNKTLTSTGSGLFTFSGGITGAQDLTLNANSTGGITLSTNSVNNTGTITNTGTGSGTTTISALIGSNVTGIVQNSATSELRLSASNTAAYLNGITVKAGTLFAITGATPFGATSNVITLGDSAVNLAATLTVNLGSGSPVGNAIVLASGVNAPLTISSPNTGSQATFTGGITGNNNLVLSATGTNAAGGLHANAVNNSGTVTSNGTGSGTTTIDLLGPNVTSVTQAGASPFVINSAFALSATNKTLISTGSGLFTLSGGITGAQNLTLNANSTGGITLSSNSINNTGTITISGTGTGTNTLSGGIGSNVTNIVANAVGNVVFSTNAVNNSGNITISSAGAANTAVFSAAVNNAGTITNNGTSTGLTSFTGGVGANVTAITENSGTSSLTISGSGLTVNAGGTTLTTNNSSGSSVLTVSGGVSGTGNLIINNNSAIANGITFTTTGINPIGTITNSGTGSGTETIGVVIGANVTGVIQNSATSQLTLTVANLYTGPTSVTAGTLLLSGATGSINSSSGISINGSTARFVQTAATAVTPVVTLSQGTLDGTTTINTVNVANSASTIVTAGNGASGTLTIGSLTYSGASTINLAAAGAAMSTTLATTTLTTNAAGNITINLTNSSLWSNSTYNLISYGSLAGNGFGSFTLGTVSGLTSRQSASLTNPAGFITLSVTGDNPVWTGLVDGRWTTAIIAPPKNWKLITGGTATDFLTNDNVLFDDSAAGTTVVNITDSNVAPIVTTFNNTTKNYTLGSPGGFGISTGSLTKSGTGSLTINNTNTYSGATTIQNGSVVLGVDNALPTATSLILGNNLTGASSTQGTLNLSNASQTVASLTVQSDNAAANQIIIGTGRTLTVNGNVIVGEANGVKTTPKLTMSGGGSLSVINNTSGAVFQVGANISETTASGNNAVVDLSGLSSVTISLNTTNGAVNIGDNVGNNANSGVFSSLFLPTTGAGNTTITAATLNVGPQGRNSTTAPVVNVLKLGSGANVFNVTNFNIGGVATGGAGIRDAGSVTFTNASGTIRLRDTTGTGRANLNIAANAAANTAANRTNTFDVRGHDADLLIGTLTIGDASSNSGNQDNTFSFDTGTLDVTAIRLARRSGTTSNTSIFTTTVNFGSTPASTGVVNVGSGGITLLNQANTSLSSPVVSTLNILGGTVNVGGDIIQTVTGTAQHTGTLNLNGGTLNMNGKRIGGSAATNNIDVLTFQSGTLMNVAEINNGAVLTKTGAASDTLIMTGNNTYAGGTLVSAGTLVTNSTTALGSGNVTVNSGSFLRVGNGISSQELQLNGSLTNSGTLQLDIFSNSGGANPNTAGDFITFIGVDRSITLTGTLAVNNFNNLMAGNFNPGDSFLLVDWSAITTVSNRNVAGLTFDLSSFTGVGFDTTNFQNTGRIVVVSVVPEPDRMLLLSFGLMALLFRRRRRPYIRL